jgi:hypothetical protein
MMGARGDISLMHRSSGDTIAEQRFRKNAPQISAFHRGDPEVQIFYPMKGIDFIEASDVLPHAPAKHRGGMGGAARQRRDHVARRGSPHIAGFAEPSNRRGDEPDRLVGIQHRGRALQVARLEDVVRVERDQVLGGREADPVVSRSCEAAIRGADNRDLRPGPRLQELTRIEIGGAIVHQDDFSWLARLAQDALDGLRDRSALVVAGNNDSNRSHDLRSAAGGVVPDIAGDDMRFSSR